MTARKAANEGEEMRSEELKQPDFKRAIKVLTHDIGPISEQSSKLSGDASAAWKVIEEKCHVNKAAAKTYKRMVDMTEKLRDDFLRSLYGLMSEGKIGISADLVDKMEGGEGAAPTMPVVAAKDKSSDLATIQ